MALGIGDGLDVNAGYNLRTVSGRDRYDPGGDDDADPHTTSDLLEADYLQESGYDAAGEALRDVVLSSCAPSVSVIKQIVPDGGTIADAYTPSEGWDFEAQSRTPGTTVTPQAGTTDPTTGGLSFDLDFPVESSPADVRIEEDPLTGQGYTPMPEATTCVNKTTGEDTPVDHVYEPGSETAFHVEVGTDDAVSCVVYNRAPDFTQASVVVHKRWRIVSEPGTQDVPHGGQPAGLGSVLELSGPAGAAPSVQGWDEPRAGYDTGTDSPVTISEEFQSRLPGCELQEATIEPGAPEESSPLTGDQLDVDDPTSQQQLSSGTNEWTISNLVVCTSRLTLRKEVAAGPAQPDWWTLDAIGPKERPDPAA